MKFLKLQKKWANGEYIDALKKELPHALQPSSQHVSSSPEDKLACLADGRLWFDVKVGNRREFLPFRIHWIEHIPTMEKLAFLFPLSTFHVLKIDSHNPNIQYYPEAEGGRAERIKALAIWDEPSEARYRALADCIKNARIDVSTIILDRPQTKTWVSGCAKQHNVALIDGDQRLDAPHVTIAELVEGDLLDSDAAGYLVVPCHKLKKDWKHHIICTDNESVPSKIEPSKVLGGYPKALVYVLQRVLLATTLKKLSDLKKEPHVGSQQALYIHPVYEDALVRFSFIGEVMAMLSRYYVVFFALFLIILLCVQTGIVIVHRRFTYGVFLAKGMSWRQVCAIVLVQITLSFLAAFGSAIALLLLMGFLLHLALEHVLFSPQYSAHIFSDLGRPNRPSSITHFLDRLI